ncbi:hypothetical protein B0H15DRAFT_536614 [Mycena belliarum]|uniref:non-specific serine/threonine protein kinase n=1 Tax=Mycena belliarum TaxID=1033014 RepID=A0AAD6TY45_9AGAR|nr:hypothetical protein B0H15DRAFT_536614 [Mycena belliae]
MSCSLDTHIRRFRAPFKTRRVTRSEKGLSTSSSVPSSGETDLEKGDAKTHAPAPSAPHMKEGTGSDEGQVVRQGEVCVKECGMHPRSWFRRDRWLSLSETRLALHPAQTKVPRSSILLSDIARLERTDSVPCGLSLQTKNQRRYLLTFGTDGDLYDWQDDISCRSMGVSNPSNFVHQTHATFDPVNGGFTGLPPGWEKVLIRAYEPDELKSSTSL